MPSSVDVAGCAALIILCPVVVSLTWSTLEHFGGSFADLLYALGSSERSTVLLQAFEPFSAAPSWIETRFYASWLIFQGVLYAVLPSKTGYGNQTPGGNVLAYKVNGLFAWFLSHVVFVYGAWVAGWWDPALIATHWTGFLVAANAYGFALSVFVYLKAYIFPSHPQDRKFSGSWIVDLFLGVELVNACASDLAFRRGLWDIKLFHNDRPGIIAWTLINLSYTTWQYQQFGYVSNSIIIVNILQAIYVLDQFYNEDWYLRAMDISHEHFGFYLAWGDAVWLPSIYTLQAQYLARYPVDLPLVVCISLLCLGVLGFWIYRTSNNEKDLARRTNGQCEIWGQKAVVIRTQYVTFDGQSRSGLLLCSGFWGVVRHANYLGDLIMSFAMCTACGFNHLLPYTYLFWMVVLLVHRSSRDERRCSAKYGRYWDEYKRRVPYAIIPGVF